MTTRRYFLLGAAGCAIALPLAARGQTKPARVYRVGVLGSESSAYDANRMEIFRAALAERGYVEGRNLVIVTRRAEGDYARLPALAAELLRENVDVVVANGSKAGKAAMEATTRVPIVVSNMGDAINPGFAAKYGQPGGNVTGMSMQNPEVAAKQLELLRQVKPRSATVAVLVDPANPNAGLVLETLRRHGKSLKLAILPVEVRRPEALPGAFAAMGKAGVDALLVQSDTLFAANAKTICDLALERRVAAIGTLEFALAGGLIGYAPDRKDGWRRIAAYVDKVLMGAKPADLPVEQPTKIDLVVNLRTAKTLGLTIPQALLLRADEVIR
jgi:putative ABC transport system substrate-binding protein